MTARIADARQVCSVAARLGCALAGRCTKESSLRGGQKQEAVLGHNLHMKERMKPLICKVCTPRKRGTLPEATVQRASKAFSATA